MKNVVTKKIVIDGKFVETKFYPIGHESKTKFWSLNNYGRSVYPITWWTTFDSVYVREDIYTHTINYVDKGK
jgi:hypothetical protein